MSRVFQMASVRTSIIGRPRRLSPHRRAHPATDRYTLICEEPLIIEPGATVGAVSHRGFRGCVVSRGPRKGRREDVLKIRLHEGGQLGAVRYRADSGGLHRLEVDAEAGELVGQLLGQLLGGVCEMSPVGRVVAAGANLALRGSWSG